MIVFNSTVLPQPLSPITANVWPRRDREVDVAEHALPPEIDPYPLQLDQGRCRSGFSLEAVTMAL